MNNEVVRYSVKNSIATVAMEEREEKNTFSDRFVKSLSDTFKQIAENKHVKVVVLHGYDNYFCCGGTKQELIKLHEGMGKSRDERIQFDDLRFHDLLLHCPVPVISAMQGHAIGGGLAFGCFADIIIMAEECIYNAVFMKYGFTPGFGATYIIPYKLGNLLGNDMLFTARAYYGRELKTRGVPATVVKKDQVLEQAFKTATEIAEKPLQALKLLKKNQNRKIHRELPNYIAKEVKMHQETFPQKEVLSRIEQSFNK